MKGLKMKRFEWKQVFYATCLNQNFNSFLVSSDYLRLKP